MDVYVNKSNNRMGKPQKLITMTMKKNIIFFYAQNRNHSSLEDLGERFDISANSAGEVFVISLSRICQQSTKRLSNFYGSDRQIDGTEIFSQMPNDLYI